jgi:hypothetical protein
METHRPLILLRDQIERVISRKIKIEKFIRWYEDDFFDLLEKPGSFNDIDTDISFLTNYKCDFSFYEEQPEVRAEYDRYYGDDKFFKLVRELRARIDEILERNG